MNKKKWSDTVLKNYKKKHPNVSQDDINHIFDWMDNTKEKISIRMSFPQALKKANDWMAKLNKLNEQGITGPGFTKEFMSFDKGYKIVSLEDEMSYKWEGYHMGHCVASYFDKSESIIYSLRDKNDMPHCTIEVGPEWRFIVPVDLKKTTHTNNPLVKQIQGKGNGPVKPIYANYILQFLDKIDLEVKSFCLEKLGYASLDLDSLYFLKNFYENLKTITRNKKVYVYTGNKLIRNEEFDKYIMANGVSVPRAFNELLVFFAKKNDIEEVHYLLAVGANPKYIEKAVLMNLVINNHFEVLEMLTLRGAYISFDNFYLLNLAIANNNFNIAHLLVSRGANVDNGLRYAVEYGVFDMVRLFVEYYHADIFQPGLLPAAVHRNLLKISEYLRARGAIMTPDLYRYEHITRNQEYEAMRPRYEAMIQFDRGLNLDDFLAPPACRNSGA